MEQTTEMVDSEVATAAEEPHEAVDTSFSPEDEVIDETEHETEVDDGEEIDYEGEKYRVPAKLKEAFLRQQDYTQKTQTLAEQRKQVEAERASIQQRAQMQHQYVQEIAEAVAIDKQLAQYKNLDWNGLIDSDPVQAMKLDRQMKELLANREQVVGRITQKQQMQAMEEQQFTAKQLQEAKAVLERDIPNWSKETATTLREYGKTIGFSDSELENVSNPIAVKLLHKAYLYDQLAAKKQAKPEPAKQEKPVPTISANKGTATKSPSQMSDKEFAQWRARQIKNR